ncbi:uncharacterized protein LOC104902922 [Beta vulgaris subsp. vulgaris]|uniref:uncharacterized protein LOC104902922 n=1 Tax=Beta vulgaris subsp. vulgaris TaxID=3555 RepID=UPI00053FDAD6|nr:uncharacterized protein LOC104902922 [Beta vulgaris subsp. vulgaris]
MASDFDLNAAWCPDYMGLDDEEHDFPAHNEQGNFDLNLEPHEDESNFIQPTEVLEHQANDNTMVAVNHHKRSRLNSEDKLQIFCWLLNKAKAGKLKRGSIKDAASVFNLSVRCIISIWNTARKQSSSMQRYNVSTKFHFSGRKRIQVQLDEITKLKMGERSCIRDLATMLNKSKSTVHRMIKRGLIKPHTNSLHPGLKEPNKIERLKWIFQLLMGNTPETMREYYPMYDIVHLDEKWFYLSTKSHGVYLAQNERGRYRAASSSKFIPKVMFTACVARPRYNSEGVCTFDGKIEIFPFTYQEAAKRTSKNRAKGTMITKVIESVNQKVTRDMLINEIIPAIKEKWPRDGGPTTIFLQQDNAKAHITHEDPEWQLIHEQDGFTFILI